MKELLRKVFRPILSPFESGDGEFAYKKSHRTILIVVGCLFAVLAVGGIAAALVVGQYAGLLAVMVFFAVAVTCIVVGALGSDRAVSKIWGSK